MTDFSFKVICDFQGQPYIKSAISALFLPVETQYVLPSYRKSGSRNLRMILELIFDLSFKVIGDLKVNLIQNMLYLIYYCL